MKNAKSIISHALKPFEERLEAQKCLNLVFSMLPANIKNGINYSYVKENTLYISVVSNPFKSELNYKKNLLKELLETIKKHNSLCDYVSFNDVKIFVSREKKPVEKQQVLIYEERAFGDFENLAKNEKIKELLEQIREVIRKA